VSKEQRDILAQLSLEERLDTILRQCEFYTRGVYENDLPRGYNPASYALWLTVVRGTINGETYMALSAMSFRELCGLVHTLLTECGEDMSRYPGFLMKRYTKAA
jgi:hypothetical protein